MANNDFFSTAAERAAAEQPTFGLPEWAKKERAPSVSAGAGNIPFMDAFTSSAQRYGVPVNVLMALGEQESSFNPTALGQPTKYGRAKGLMQYIDSTAAGMGINPYDPVQSIDAAAKQLRDRLDKGYSMQEAVSAHFAGDDRKQWGPKTAVYGQEVMARAEKFLNGGKATVARGGGQQPDQAAPFDMSQEREQYPAAQSAMENMDQTRLRTQAMLDDLNKQEPGRYRPLTADELLQLQQQANAGQQQKPIGNTDATPITIPGEEQAAATAQPQKRQAELRSWEPSLWDKFLALLPGNKDAATVEMIARDIAKKEGISVEEVYKSVGGARPIFNPEGRPPLRALAEGATVVGKQLPNVPAATANATMRAVRGGDIPAQDGMIDRAIKATDTKPDPNADPNYSSLQGIDQSLGFSVSNLLPSLAAGAAGNAVSPGVGTAAGMVTSGSIAYRAAKDQFLSDVKDMAEKKKGSALTEKEWDDIKLASDGAATEYGAWEAIPEAISNAIALKMIAHPLAGGTRAARLMDASKRILKEQAGEQVSETVTSVGQNKAERDVGLTNRVLSPGDAFREQFLQTAIVSGIQGGAMQGGRAVYDRVRGNTGAASAADAGTPQAEQPAPVQTEEQPAAAAAAPVDLPADLPQVSKATGPIARSMENADNLARTVQEANAAQQQAEPVTATDEFMGPIGAQTTVTPAEDPQGAFSATVEGYTNGEAIVRGEDGSRYQFGPTDVVRPTNQATQATTTTVPATETASNEGEKPEARRVQVEDRPATRTLEEMSEPELRERLQYLARQAKNSGWDKRLTAERRRVEAAIDAKTQSAVSGNDNQPGVEVLGEQQRDNAAPADRGVEGAKPAGEAGSTAAVARNEPSVGTGGAADTSSAGNPALTTSQPADVKWFGTADKAQSYIDKKGLADTHEVRPSGRRFEVQPKATQDATLTNEDTTSAGNVTGRVPGGPRTNRARKLLNAEIGAVVSPQEDIGQATAGRSYSVDRIEKNGTVHLTNTENGAGTTVTLAELERAHGRKTGWTTSPAATEKSSTPRAQTAPEQGGSMDDMVAGFDRDVKPKSGDASSYASERVISQADVNARGDGLESPWLFPDGRIVGSNGDHISLSDAFGHNGYRDMSLDTGAIRSQFHKGKGGDQSFVSLHLFDDQKLTQAQYQAVESFAQANDAAISLGVDKTGRNTENVAQDEITLSELRDQHTEITRPARTDSVAKKESKAPKAQRSADTSTLTDADSTELLQRALAANQAEPGRLFRYGDGAYDTYDFPGLALDLLKAKNGSSFELANMHAILSDLRAAAPDFKVKTGDQAATSRESTDDSRATRPSVVGGIYTPTVDIARTAKAGRDYELIEKGSSGYIRLRDVESGAEMNIPAGVLQQNEGNWIARKGTDTAPETAKSASEAEKSATEQPKASANTIFTEDAAERARKLLRSKLSQLNSGIDPEIMQAGITLAGYHIEKGARTFSAYARAMVADLGDMVRPYLKSWYMGVKYDPRAAGFEGMSTAADVEAADVNTIEAITDEPQQLDQSGARPLEDAPADAVQGTAGEEPAGQRAPAGGRADASGNERSGGVRVQQPRSVGDDQGTLPLPAGRSEPAGQRNEPVSEADAGRDGDRQRAVPGRERTRPVSGTVAEDRPVGAFTIDADEIGKGGDKTKYRNNVAAIRLLKELETANRPAAREEQAILSKYVGWGGLPAAFERTDGSAGKGWEKEVAELKGLMTAEEYAAAQSSTKNAHYTSPEIVSGMWDAMRRMGFRGGRVIEPSVGVGNFFGMMPADVRAASALHGVELDHITSGIATQLYPEAKIARMGYQDYVIPDGYFDIAIGNPPFGADRLYDGRRKDLSGFNIHNYFFARSVDALRPGGVLGMVVTNRMLDSASDKARQYIADKADFLGAIRLPNNAFAKNAGTEVTTDIIFLRRRAEGEAPAGAQWMNTVDYTDKEGRKVPLNEYFAANPDMMLGDFGAYGTMYRAGDTALVAREGQNTGAELQRAIARLPADIITQAETVQPETRATVAAENARVGSMFMDGDQVMIRRDDVMGESQGEAVSFPNEKARTRVVGMIGLRDHLADLRKLQLDARADDTRIEAARARLNAGYDAFVKENGPINLDANKRLFRDDPTWPQISALEEGFDRGISATIAKKTGEEARPPSATKAAIFSKRTQSPYSPPTSASTAKDALVTALAERGHVDMQMMQELYGKSESEIARELGDLIFSDPNKGWVTRDEYLSGNVKAKLAQARERAANDAAFNRNVEALEAVQPKDIEAVDISVKPGATWLPAQTMGAFADFIAEETGTKAFYNPITAKWSFPNLKGSASAAARFGTGRMDLRSVLEAAAAQKALQVYDQHQDGSRTLNETETQLANDKVAAVREEFGRWLWADDERRRQLARIYNDQFNTDVPRVYDGAHLSFPGKIGDDIIRLRPHQANAVWRIVQGGTTLTDHVVGAGKTFTLIAAAMELRRMGLAKKPLFAVPNHLVGQWATDFVKLYPGANVLAATKQDFEKANRKRLFARIATGDWDAVIVAHSSFGKVQVDPQSEAEFIQEQISDLTASMEAIREAEGGKSRNVKDAAKRRDALQEKLKALLDTDNKDDSLYWSELGVDALFLDEAHEFKNLAYSTSMRNVAGLGDPSGSQKAMDMFMKVRMTLKATGGRNVVFATGTPISNTMAEMYTMQRYMDYDTLQAQGLAHFDAWARMFGEVVTDWELSPSGKYKMNSRFAKFVNMPELMQRYTSFADVINRDDINRMLAAQGKKLPVPKVAGGKPTNVVVPRSPDQADYIGEATTDGNAMEVYPEGTLVWRSENLPKRPEKGADNMLKIMSDARKAALDMRLIDPSYPDNPHSKVNEAADRIKAHYDKWAADRGAQLVFIDLSTPKNAKAGEAERLRDLARRADEGDEDAIAALDKISPDELLALDGDFSVYDDLKLKLISRGIPEAEIAFIHDAKTELQKEELFGKVRTGRIRVLFGSTAKMGAGMNVQNRLVALHHLDAPWRPSDLEQREGRIIRQGNELYDRDPEGFEVNIERYATKQTLDSRMWQTIEAKANFIEQIRKGNTGTREIEDIGGEAANAAEMKAASSGNPLILEEMTLRQRIRRLENERTGHDRNQFRIRDSIQYQQKRAVSAEKELDNLRQDVKRAQPAEFAMTIGNETFDKRKDGGEAILAAAANMEQNGIEELEIGRYGDFTLQLERLSAEKFEITVQGAGDYTAAFGLGADAVGTAMRVTNAVKDLGGAIEKMEQARDQALAEVPKLEAQREDWPKDAELAEARQRHSEVLEQLKPKQQNVAPSVAETATQPQQSQRMSVAAARGSMTRGELGSVIEKMADAGAVVLHDQPPAGNLAGAAGWVDAQGRVNLNLQRLTPATVQQTIMHEFFHTGIDAISGTPRWDNLMDRLNDYALRARARAADGRATATNEWDKAFSRVLNAQRAGDEMGRGTPGHYDWVAEELGAYAVEHFEQMPAGIRKWAETVIGMVKDFVARKLGVQLGKVTPAQLRALAAASLRSRQDTTAGAVIHSRQDAAAGNVRRVEPEADNWPADFMVELSAVDDLFANPPAPGAYSLKNVFQAVDPTVKVLGETGRVDEHEESGADERFLLQTGNGKDFYVYQTPDRVWLDVSRLDPGDGGSTIYAAVADYALNTKRLFIGDPAGLSDEAMRRRTDAMLSSALKHGTTAHLAPHPRQIEGDAKLGIPPLQWRDGDDLGNIRSLINVSVESLAHYIPEIKRARYDFATRTFRNNQGKPLDDATLREWSATYSRIRAASAGSATLKRGILLNTLARTESGERPGLLAQVIRQPDQLVGESLRGTFYSIPGMEADPNPPTTEENDSTVRRWWDTTKNWTTDKLTQAMPKLLATVPMRPLVRELGRNLAGAADYMRLKQSMDAMRSEWHAKTDKVAQRWLKYRVTNKAENAELMDIMHEATRAQADPAERFAPLMTDRERDALRTAPINSGQYESLVKKAAQDKKRREAHRSLVERWNKLSPEAREIYKEVRETYKAMADAYEGILLKNMEKAINVRIKKAEREHRRDMEEIADLGLTGQEKQDAIDVANGRLRAAKTKISWNRKARITQLRQQFEMERLAGPYFPLARFGNFFVTVRNKEEGYVESFSRFEDVTAQRKFANLMRQNPEYEVEIGALDDSASVRKAVDPNFVADVEDILADLPNADKVKDEVWQRYLETLPDLSVRKNRIHRKGRAGYDADALRAFGNQMFHGSHQLARLAHSFDMEEAIDAAREEARNTPDPVRDTLVVNEIAKRHDFVMNPTGGSIAQSITSAAFIYHLSVSPAAAIVNMSQTVIIGVPMLAAYHGGARGFTRASTQLMKALRDFTMGRGYAERSKYLTADEKAAMEQGYNTGIIDRTQSHDLAGVGDTGVEYSPRRAKAMAAISWAFHHTERLNREVTFLAAYRMARSKGENAMQAVNTAGDLTWKTHFDYQNTSRPRVMHSDTAKALLVFRNYNVNMLWRLFRDTHQSLNGESKEVRREAFTQLAGVTGMMMANAGIKGTWMFGIAMVLAGMFLGDGEDPEDELKKAMVKSIGPMMAGIALDGIPGYITGTSISERIGMPDLWFRSPDRQLEGQDEYNYWMGQALGAAPGIVQNAMRGFQMIKQDQTYRGIETLAPKAIKDLMRAYRYQTEGVTTLKGDKLLETVTPWETFVQALGFTPAALAERYDINNANMNKQKFILGERKKLLDRYARADKAGDDKAMDRIDGEMDKFSAKYPEQEITEKVKRNSLRTRERNRENNDAGMLYNSRLRERILEEQVPTVYR